MTRYRIQVYYGPSPRLDGTAFFFHQALRRVPGTEVVRYTCDVNPALLAKADLHVAVDWAEDLWPETKAFIEPRPLVYWMSDTHCSEESKRFRYEKAKRAEHVYCAIWSDVPELAKEGVTARWLPYAAEPLCFNTWDAEQKYDVSFVGHVGDYPGRIEFLDEMFKAFPNFNFTYNLFHEHCALEMRKSMVILNHTWRKETVNMRVFEALSCRRCLVTPLTDDLAWLGIEDGVHCLTYRTTEEAIEKTRDVLKDDEKRERIATAGRDLILAQHTYLHRAMTVLRDVTGKPWEVDMKALLETLPGKGYEWGPRENRLPLALPLG